MKKQKTLSYCYCCGQINDFYLRNKKPTKYCKTCYKTMDKNDRFNREYANLFEMVSNVL